MRITENVVSYKPCPYPKRNLIGQFEEVLGRLSYA
jgi:hypothetical protein